MKLRELTPVANAYLKAISAQYGELYAGYRRQLPHPDIMEAEIRVLYKDLFSEIPIDELEEVFQMVRLRINRWPTTADICSVYRQKGKVDRTQKRICTARITQGDF